MDHQSALFEVGDWVKNKWSPLGEKKTETGGQAEQCKALAEPMNTIRVNGVKHGVPLGATKKDLVIIAQAESQADQHSHECNVLALTQLIESKQKQVASFTICCRYQVWNWSRKLKY